MRTYGNAMKGVSVLAMAILLSACGGGSSDGGASPSGSVAPPPPSAVTTPPPVTTPAPVASSYTIQTTAQAYDFLNRATFGARETDLDAMVGMSATDYIADQFTKPVDYRLDDLIALRARGENSFAFMEGAYWDKFLNGEDQLRQRMVWALSQIVVKSVGINEDVRRNVHVMDVYNEHALGNYGDLLVEITFTPAMANFLTYLNSRRADDRTGAMPDENYAREIMQLFSIGLVELNMDGTPKLGADGRQIETYTNEDVIGLARVFTGFRLQEDSGNWTRMRFDERRHEDGEKTFLGHTIAAGTPGEASVREAVQVLLDHPNTPPFIARQLIQRFTQSAPSPQYVERVATAFANGSFTAQDGATFGDGRRGDLQATVAAILLDAQFFDDVPAGPAEGKLREPVLRLAHVLRAFEFNDPDPTTHRYAFALAARDDRMGQGPMRAPSVFGYYRPGFLSESSESGLAGLTAPELQFQTAATIRANADGIAAFVFAGSENRSEPTDGFYPLLSAEVALSETPEAMVDRVDRLLTNGRLDPVSRARLLESLAEMPARLDREDLVERDRLARAKFAIWWVATSTDFAISQ